LAAAEDLTKGPQKICTMGTNWTHCFCALEDRDPSY